MPNNDGENGLNPGGDDDANKQSDKGGKPAGDKGNKDKGGKGKDDAGDDDDDSDDDSKGEVKKSYTQKQIDDMINKRVARATQKLKDDAELSETDRLKKEAADARAEVRERDLKDEFETISGLDKAKSNRLFKMFRDDMDVDDKGKWTNKKEVMKMAKDEWPELFSKLSGKGDGGNGGGNNSEKPLNGDMNSAIRGLAGRGNR